MKANNAPMEPWRLRHIQAMEDPRGAEIPIVNMLRELRRYRNQHLERYDVPIDRDFVLGPAYAAIVQGVRELLNGETGRIDCGSLDRELVSLLGDLADETEAG